MYFCFLLPLGLFLRLYLLIIYLITTLQKALAYIIIFILCISVFMYSVYFVRFWYEDLVVFRNREVSIVFCALELLAQTLSVLCKLERTLL